MEAALMERKARTRVSRLSGIPQRTIRKAVNNRPAGSLAGFVWHMTGSGQMLAIVLSIIITLLALAPIELQRRMVDHAIGNNDARLLITLALIYAATIVLHQGFKLGLGVLQNWMSESAIARMRAYLWDRRGDETGKSGEGRDIVSVMTTETTALGGFAGGAPSLAVANIAMLIGTLGYMFWMAPLVALAGLALLIPQAVMAPLMQKRLNRLVAIRLRMMRRFTAALGRDMPPEAEELSLRAHHLFDSRLIFVLWKYAMKAMLNLMNGAAPLAVIGLGGWMVINGDTTIGVVIAFVGGFSRLGDPVRQLIAFYREAAEARVRHRMVVTWMTKADD